MVSKDRESTIPPPDSSPSVGGTVRRRYGGRERSTPVVKQSAFISENNGQIELTTELQANTGRGLKSLQPIEQVLHSTERPIDPVTARKALRQQAAIVGHSRNGGNRRRKH